VIGDEGGLGDCIRKVRDMYVSLSYNWYKYKVD